MKQRGKGRPSRKTEASKACPKCGSITEALISIQDRDISRREILIYGDCGHIAFGNEFLADKYVNLYNSKGAAEILRFFQRKGLL